MINLSRLKSFQVVLLLVALFSLLSLGANVSEAKIGSFFGRDKDQDKETEEVEEVKDEAEAPKKKGAFGSFLKGVGNAAAGAAGAAGGAGGAIGGLAGSLAGQSEETDEAPEQKSSWTSGLASSVGGSGVGGIIAGQAVKVAAEEVLFSDDELAEEIRYKNTELDRLQTELEAEYDRLQADFMAIIGVYGEDQMLNEQSLLYSVRQLDMATRQITLPDQEELVSDVIGVNMEFFIDDSGAVDYARFATVSSALEGQVRDQAVKLNELISLELETADKQVVVSTFNDFSIAVKNVSLAEAKYLQDTEELKAITLQKRQEAEEIIKSNRVRLVATVAAKGYASKEMIDQMLDMNNVAATGGALQLGADAGQETVEGFAALFNSFRTRVGFWKGVEERDVRFAYAKEGIRNTVLVVNQQYDSVYKAVEEIAREVGIESLEGYFKEYQEAIAELDSES